MTEAVLRQSSPNSDLAPENKQQIASNPNASVWVNASAGSGKTTVLTQRVMRLLLDGVKPERILCLTYTRAAAAEMSNRVMSKLSIWATCSDNDLSASISDLQGKAPTPKQMIAARRLFAHVLACPGGMRIRTLHAFCQEILRRFPVEAGLPPHFTVIEESDAKALQEEVVHDLLRRAGDTPESELGSALKILVLNLGEHKFDEALRSVLSERPRLQAALTDTTEPEQLIAQMRAELNLVPEDTAEKFCLDAVKDSAFAKADLQRAAKYLLEGSKTYAPRGEKILEWLQASADDRVAKFDDYCRCFLTADGAPYKSYANKDLLAKYPDLTGIFDRESARLQAINKKIEAVELAETTAAILTFGSAFIDQYGSRKIAQAALDYDDLIIRTQELLRQSGIAPWILYKLDGGLDHMLVDEAQDTSRAQWNIVASLADEFFAGSTARSSQNRTLFVVGDEKQSIFSFQRADPEAFLQMRQYFEQRITNADKIYREVPMRISFRSAPAILQAVDKIFAAAAVRSGVSIEPVEHMPALPRAGEEQKIGRVEIWPLQPAPAKDNADIEEWQLPLGYEVEHDPQAVLAQQIADKIKYQMDKAAWSAGDIMILLRRRGRFADLMVRALKERDVPVTGVDRMRLVQQLSVMDLLALIQFVLLPEDDLNLATVLRGPLLNLSEENLMDLAIGREGSLWQALNQKKEHKNFKPIYDYLLRWLNAADFTSPFVLLSNLLSETCPGSSISGKYAIWRRLGLDAIDPLDELLNAAQNFSRSHTPSLQSFLQWLNATESEIKRELDRGGGQVRIMTVHASKGLEAPIVFLPDSASLPRPQDVPKFLWGRGDVPFYASGRPDIDLPRSLWEAGRRRQMEEYRRLMYVALTRASHELYIAGWESARKESNSAESWYNITLEALKDLHQPSAVLQQEHVDSLPLAGRVREGGERLGTVSNSETNYQWMAPPPMTPLASYLPREGGGTLLSFPQPLIVFADPDLRAEKKETFTKPEISSAIILPVWIRQNPPQENPLVKTTAPSQNPQAPASAAPDSAFTRGRIIHRLLQSLPDVEASKRGAVATRFLANPQHQLSGVQQDDIHREVMGLLNNVDYAPLFAPGSRAEVPIIGTVNGKALSGQVDRLCPVGNEIWIVDYKTNRPPPDDVQAVPQIYREQLAAYRALLQEIYPGKAIRCFLLWTYKLTLMELPDTFLSGP